MKKILYFSLYIFLFCLKPTSSPAQDVSVSYQVFYDELSSYGQWINYPNYGYVWVPAVEVGFSPYSTNGHWIFTDYGWTWESNYNWGWAPFHYGRWNYDNYYGWLWFPNTEWGPAWVTWRHSSGYYGWAPMSSGVSVNISFGSGYNVPNDHWRFVRDRDLDRADINRYYINRSQNVTIINNSTVITNTGRDNRRNVVYVAGPNREDIQKVSNRKITPVSIRETSRPGQKQSGNNLEIYRPQIKNGSANDKKIAPSKVNEYKSGKGIQNNNSKSQDPKGNDVKQQKNTSAPNNKTKEGGSPNKINATPMDKNVNQNQPAHKKQEPQQAPEKKQPSQPHQQQAPENKNQKSQQQQQQQPERKQQAPQQQQQQPERRQQAPQQQQERRQEPQQQQERRQAPQQQQERRQQAPQKQQPERNRPAPEQKPQQQNQEGRPNVSPHEQQNGNNQDQNNRDNRENPPH